MCSIRHSGFSQVESLNNGSVCFSAKSWLNQMWVRLVDQSTHERWIWSSSVGSTHCSSKTAMNKCCSCTKSYWYHAVVMYLSCHMLCLTCRDQLLAPAGCLPRADHVPVAQWACAKMWWHVNSQEFMSQIVLHGFDITQKCCHQIKCHF